LGTETDFVCEIGVCPRFSGYNPIGKGEVDTMTRLLEKALREALKLPTREQNAFAKIMLEELSSERKWARKFSKSHDKLAALAAEALGEHRQGKTVPLEKTI
jgi:hypothetical protein